MTHPGEGSNQPDEQDAVGDVMERARAFHARVHEQGVGALENESSETTINGAIAHGPHANAMAESGTMVERRNKEERDRSWLLRQLSAYIAELDEQIAEIDRAFSAIDSLEALLASGEFDPNNPTEEQAALMAQAGLTADDFEGRDPEEVFRERREELERDREEYVERRREAEELSRELESGSPDAVSRARELMQSTDDISLRDDLGSLTQSLDQIDAESQERVVENLGRSEQATDLLLDAAAQDDLAAWSPGSFASTLSGTPISAAPAGSAFRNAVQNPPSAAASTPASEAEPERETVTSRVEPT